MSPTIRWIVLQRIFLLVSLASVFVNLSSCGTRKPVSSSSPPPVDFARALLYAERAELAYQPESIIQQRSGSGVQIQVSPPLSSGIRAYVERNDVEGVQWIVVRGTSKLVNMRLDVDYNKVIASRLEIPLHKGFADAAMDVSQFAVPLLKKDYETRVTGHSLGGAAAVIVLMLLKEDGLQLGQAITFGQPKVTNLSGARKYPNLPLLRFVTVRDPVPSMPPLEVFAVLDEGPYVHLAPEVVLEEGANYQYHSAHQAQRLSVLSFWKNLKDRSIQDLPQHQMSTYRQRIEEKIPSIPANPNR